MTTYSSSFHEVRQHDDHRDVLLPDHAPEIIGRALHRTLSRNVLPLAVETLSPTLSLHFAVFYNGMLKNSQICEPITTAKLRVRNDIITRKPTNITPSVMKTTHAIFLLQI